jgi:hypothetical protein
MELENAPYTERYTTYARAHGNTPEVQIEEDKVNWPGGKMCGFILWHKETVREFARVSRGSFFISNFSGDFNPRPPVLVDHEAFDEWLLAKYPILPVSMD